MSTPRIAFGLKAGPQKKQPSATKKSAFGAEDSDDEKPLVNPILSTKKTQVSTASLSKAQKTKQKLEASLDPSVYQYDEVFDQMKEAAEKAQKSKLQQAAENKNKPKYIEGLLKTAEQRKLDRLRAEDKMVAREREREGGEFADKDSFVTSSYLKQQEELRKREEEEKKAEEAAQAKRKPGQLSSFFSSYLESTSAVHEAAVAATLTAKPRAGPELPTKKELSDAQLAEAARKEGRKVELNDDGVIIDRRELLGGGLNIIKKTGKSTSMGFSASIKERQRAAEMEAKKEADSGEAQEPSLAELLGNGMTPEQRRNERRARQSREIERQMLAHEERAKREAEEELQKKVTKLARRNDESAIEKRKREALERRKLKEAQNA